MSEGYDLARLRAGTPPRRVEFREEAESTQDLAFAMAEHGAPDGTVALADRQTRGRGRLGRAWASAGGKGVEFSVVLRPPAQPVPSHGLLVAATAVAVAEALESTAGIAPAIRWPNDLLVGERKVCGILLETRDYEPAAPLLVLGIGINAGQEAADFPEEVRAEATSLRMETGREPDRTALLSATLEALDRWRTTLAEIGASVVEEAFRARVAYLGRRVRLLEGDVPVEGVLESASPVAGVFLKRRGGRWHAVRPEHARDLRPAPPVVLRPARPEDAEAIVRVNGDVWRTAYRGIFPDEVLEKRGRDPAHVERVRDRVAAGTQAIIVAEAGGEILGFSMAGKPREGLPGFDAELYALYVLHDRQKEGIGRRLLAAAAAGAGALGLRSIFLWVLRDNPGGRGFYERLGGKVVAERTATVEGVEVAEVAYGWPEIGGLSKGSGAAPPG